MSLCIIVLAAGQGTRFGGDQNKLLATCVGRDGTARAVLEHALRNLDAIEGRRLLVTRPGQPLVMNLAVAYGYDILEVETSGMGDSLAAAVRHVGSGFRWLIALGDMPFVLPETLQRVAGQGLRMTAFNVCAPCAAGRPGHPVVFGEVFFDRLLALGGDRGGKSLFNEESLVQINTDDPGIHRDVDTLQALAFNQGA